MLMKMKMNRTSFRLHPIGVVKIRMMKCVVRATKVCSMKTPQTIKVVQVKVSVVAQDTIKVEIVVSQRFGGTHMKHTQSSSTRLCKIAPVLEK